MHDYGPVITFTALTNIYKVAVKSSTRGSSHSKPAVFAIFLAVGQHFLDKTNGLLPSDWTHCFVETVRKTQMQSC